MIYLVLSFLASEDNSGLMSNEGLVFQISSLMILSGTIQILTNFFNFGSIYRWVLLKWKYHGKKDDEEILRFQVKLNR